MPQRMRGRPLELWAKEESDPSDHSSEYEEFDEPDFGVELSASTAPRGSTTRNPTKAIKAPIPAGIL
mgnify:CR=1 FL=1